jgi:hypothetical protein
MMAGGPESGSSIGRCRLSTVRVGSGAAGWGVHPRERSEANYSRSTLECERATFWLIHRDRNLQKPSGDKMYSTADANHLPPQLIQHVHRCDCALRS